jgi:SAM-dependent methyltransferase
MASGVRDHEYGAEGLFDWLRCVRCGLVRLAPAPEPERLARAYPPHYHAFASPRSRLTRWLIDRSRRRLAKTISSLLPPRGRVLDIGCSTGELLVAIGRHGEFELAGIESSPAAAQTARSRGIDVLAGDCEAVEIPPASTDLVLLQHVLEHVYDPIAMLRRIHACLRPGGRVIGELPNVASLDAWLFGRYWGGGHAPRHLWHFTPATLARALEVCGFRDARLRSALHTGHWALSIQNFLRRSRTTCDDLTSGRAWYYPLFLLATIPVNALQMPFGATGVMRFEARRPAA